MAFRCRVQTATLVGVQAVPVDVEVDIGRGLPGFTIVGLPDLAVQEARERVRSGIRSCGLEFPNARVLVNLAPGPLRKHGTGFDLPIAAGVLVATGQLPPAAVDGSLLVGELSLDGTLRPVPGLLAHARLAKERGLDLVGPPLVATGAALFGVRLRTVRTLPELLAPTGSAPPEALRQPDTACSCPDLSEVVGQELIKRALIIAAAGDHSVLMVGPPGSGKTMLARRLPGILPDLDEHDRLETALVHSVAGLDESAALAGVRPFRAPHHSASIAGLLGGGSPPRPGEVSLAHNGVLFLDELPEFGAAALQGLRQPLEDGHVVLVRVEGRVQFPSRFVLVAAANPCPCGFFGDPERACACTPTIRSRYLSRIGGPLLDRLDLCIRVDRVDPKRLLEFAPAATTVEARTRVGEARAFALGRGTLSSRLTGRALLDACALAPEDFDLLETFARLHHLSGRGITRLLRVSRTIADLEGSDRVGADHLTEAVGYRAEGSFI